MRLYLPGGLLKRPDADLSDLTASQRVGSCAWDPVELDVLVMPLDPEPDPDKQTAIRRRLVTVDAADEAHLYDLLAMTPASDFERLWRDAELSKYGEVEGA